MDRLPLHIEYLLTRHDCVIVPGFGAFIATETEAAIDLEAGIISPSRREIGFNSSVVTDDGLLSHSIARREGLSYEEARRTLVHLTERMISDLDREGEVSMGMVGKLIKDTEGLISFIPRRSAILSDILQDVRLSCPTSCSSDQIEATSTSSLETEEDDGMRTIRVRSDRYVFTISKRLVHAAAMFVAVFAIGMTILLPVNLDNQQKASVISIEELFNYSEIRDDFMIEDSTEVNLVEKDSTSTESAPTPL